MIKKRASKKKTLIQPHPWRVCPLGSHFVREHPRKSKNGTTIVKSHCRKNRSNKEILTFDEILEIFLRNKDQIATMPNASNLGYEEENKFDALIGLWVQFWNEICQTTPPLDPNWVKALIASESGFKTGDVNKDHKKNVARGLMQINEQTYKIATDTKGELKDVSFRVDEKDLFVPDANIALGTRWLFRKWEILAIKIHREPTWEEVMWEYKGIYDKSNPKAKDIKQKLREDYEKISNRT